MGINAGTELRNLMETYRKRRDKLDKELEEAAEMEPNSVESVMALRRQCKGMMAQLFKVMATIGVLDQEEIELGELKVMV